MNEQPEFERFLDEHGKTYFVLEVDGTVAGCGGYHLRDEGRIGRVSWDILHPGFKGKGLGRAIVGHCVGILQSIPSVETLEVWTSQRAFGFYAKFGFRTREVRKDFWAPGLDLYLMERGKK